MLTKEIKLKNLPRVKTTSMPNVFIKAQLSAFIGGIVDYCSMIIFTELVGVFYPISIAFSGIIGAVVNFSLNRYWTFKATEKKSVSQLKKFVVVVAGSILLKSNGTYLFTELFQFDYKISRLFIEAMVSLGFNYPLQRFWVFSSKNQNIS